ncbi:OB-fold domain-containing protein [soil metagenome]
MVVDAWIMTEPELTLPPATVYGQYLDSGRRGFQCCGSCVAAIFYPRVVCPECGSDELRWHVSNGKGTVYATTAVYHRDREPHNAVLVDLEEGFRMLSRIDNLQAEDVEIGMEVAFEVRPIDGQPEAVFVPEAR